MRSSISSSEPSRLPGGFPWALLIALLLVAAFEVGVRAALPVEEFPTRHDLRMRGSLRHVLDHHGAAEIAFIGASVCRRSTNVPRIRAAAEAELGREVRVANYSHVGLWAELGTDWVLLDTELMPWSAKAQVLLRRQYLPTVAAARISAEALLDALQAANGAEGLEPLREAAAQRRDNAEAMGRTIAGYCWEAPAISW